MGKEKTLTEKRMRTQWAAQFLAAAELVRRGYTVAFTMGNNSPDADLVVRSQGKRLFLVDVKGQSGKNPWLIKTKVNDLNLYYILVYVSDDGSKDELFVLTQKKASSLTKWYKPNPEKKWKSPGFNFKEAAPFKDHWSALPR